MVSRVSSLIGIAIAIACGLPTMANPISKADAARLTHMVRQDCGSCHGLRMTGGLGSPITPKALAGRDPEELALLILDGLPGTAMPPWRPLISDDEARWIAEYLLNPEGKP